MHLCFWSRNIIYLFLPNSHKCMTLLRCFLYGQWLWQSWRCGRFRYTLVNGKFLLHNYLLFIVYRIDEKKKRGHEWPMYSISLTTFRFYSYAEQLTFCRKTLWHAKEIFDEVTCMFYYFLYNLRKRVYIDCTINLAIW